VAIEHLWCISIIYSNHMSLMIIFVMGFITTYFTFEYLNLFALSFKGTIFAPKAITIWILLLFWSLSMIFINNFDISRYNCYGRVLGYLVFNMNIIDFLVYRHNIHRVCSWLAKTRVINIFLIINSLLLFLFLEYRCNL